MCTTAPSLLGKLCPQAEGTPLTFMLYEILLKKNKCPVVKGEASQKACMSGEGSKVSPRNSSETLAQACSFNSGPGLTLVPCLQPSRL